MLLRSLCCSQCCTSTCHIQTRCHPQEFQPRERMALQPNLEVNLSSNRSLPTKHKWLCGAYATAAASSLNVVKFVPLLFQQWHQKAVSAVCLLPLHPLTIPSQLAMLLVPLQPTESMLPARPYCSILSLVMHWCRPHGQHFSFSDASTPAAESRCH